jgi:hypothetical protein
MFQASARLCSDQQLWKELLHRRHGKSALPAEPPAAGESPSKSCMLLSTTAVQGPPPPSRPSARHDPHTQASPPPPRHRLQGTSAAACHCRTRSTRSPHLSCHHSVFRLSTPHPLWMQDPNTAAPISNKNPPAVSPVFLEPRRKSITSHPPGTTPSRPSRLCTLSPGSQYCLLLLLQQQLLLLLVICRVQLRPACQLGGLDLCPRFGCISRR